jgi:hypothetical protein
MSTEKYEFTIQKVGVNGQKTFISSTTKELPDFKEVGKHNFRGSLDQLETTVAEAAKEISTKITEHAIGEGSKKNWMTLKSSTPPKI